MKSIEGNPKNGFRKLFRHGLIVAILVFITWMVLNFLTSNPYYSNAREVRPHSRTAWEKLMHPVREIPSLDPGYMNSFNREEFGAGYMIEHPRPPEMELPYKIVEVDKNLRAEFDGGSIELQFYGLTDFHQVPDRYRELPMRFFDFAGNAITTESLASRFPGHDFNRKEAMSTPQILRLAFKLDGLDSPRLLHSRLIDAETLFATSNHCSFTNSGDYKFTDIRFVDYSLNKVYLVLDIATGPPLRRSIILDDPQPIHFDDHGIHMELLATFDEAIHIDGGGSRGTPEGIYWDHIRFQIPNNDTSRPTAQYLFKVWPFLHFPAMNGTVINAQGNRYHDRVSTSHSGIYMLKIEDVPTTSIREIAIEYLPHYHRLIFELDSLPGSEHMFQYVDNLFDTKIKTITFPDAYSLQLFPATIGQMIFFHPSNLLPRPAGYFPKTFTDVTVSDIIEEFKLYLPPKKQLMFDTDEYIIRPVDESKSTDFSGTIF